MGAWTKIFKDGSLENGTDLQIEKEEASWSRGKLTEIDHVILSNSFFTSFLKIPNTNWHQFDKYIIEVSSCSHIPKRIARVIQAEVISSHVGMYLDVSFSNKFCSVELTKERTEKQIEEKDIGKWITLLIKEDKNFSDKIPFISFSLKGSCANAN